MSIPPLTSTSIEKALESLVRKLAEIKTGTHESKKYDVLWKGYRFPPKLVVSAAVEIEHGLTLPTSEFSGGIGAGQANSVLKSLGFAVVSKEFDAPPLPLLRFARYGRKEAFASVGIKYDSRQRHLNVGLSPECKDGGYLIFVTLNKTELDPAHDYAAELFSNQLIWVTRRDVSEDQTDYAFIVVSLSTGRTLPSSTPSADARSSVICGA
jgi:hypothetical protein